MGGISIVAIVAISLFMIFVAPLWIIFGYLGRTKSAGQLTREDEQMLADLWQMARKMEDRVENLETIFDVEEPNNENK